MTEQPPRFGCFGFFWLFSLLLFMIAGAGILLWLNPMWLDQRAFWKPKPYSPEPVLLPGSEIEQASYTQDSLNPQDRIELWNEVAVKTDYSPGNGASIRTIEGTRIEFPPGCIREPAPITVTPVTRVPSSMVQGDIVPLGPIHDIRVGDQEHYVFDRPVPITIPYDPKNLPSDFSGRLAIGTWQGNQWVELPSKVDIQNHTVSAELNHSSVEGIVVIGGLTLGAVGRYTETGRAIYEQLRSRLPEVYNTPNFAIHYDTSVGLGVPKDSEYPLTGSRSNGVAPLFVQDVGTYLEDARSTLPEVGMNVAAGSPYRWDVFLMAINEFGSTDLGGPIVLDNDFKEHGEFAADYEYRLHATAIHELIHVAQDEYFNASNAGNARWWMESTAEYLANRLLELHGKPLPGINYYIRSQPQLLQTPLDRAEGLQPYAYATFFRWMQQQKNIDAVRVIRSVNKTANAKLDQLSDAVKEVSGGTTLGELFLDFSMDFYHNNLWNGNLVPLDVVTPELSRPNPFTTLTKTGTGASASIFSFVESKVTPAHMSSTYYNFRAPIMPASRNAKLVISIPSLGPQFVLANGMYGSGSYPLSGTPSILLPVLQEDPKYISKRICSPADVPDDINQISLIVGNTSTAQDGSPLTVQRWLLMPPAFVMRQKAQDGSSYQVTWQKSELKERGNAFQGYNVYRRKLGESNFPRTPINAAPIDAESFQDVPPDRDEYVYSVTILDTLGNESDLAPIEDQDPFQGDWSGKVILVKGTFVEPVMRSLQKMSKDDDPKYRKFMEQVRTLVQSLEQAARLGVPVHFRVMLENGNYKIQITRIAFKDLDDVQSEPTDMLRVGQYSITPKEKPDEGQPVVLQLHRPNEINQLYETDVKDDNGQMIHYGFRFVFQREDQPQRH